MFASHETAQKVLNWGKLRCTSCIVNLCEKHFLGCQVMSYWQALKGLSSRVIFSSFSWWMMTMVLKVWWRPDPFISLRMCEGEGDVISSAKHMKDSKEHLFIRTQTHSLQIFRVIPFIKQQNDTWTTVKWLNTVKNEMRKEITYLLFGFISSSSFKSGNLHVWIWLWEVE